MSQSLFRFYQDLDPRPLPARPTRPKPADLSKMDYDMLLTRALHRHSLSHATYAALVAAAHGQHFQPAPYTIGGIATRLGIAYHSVVWHIRKYPDLLRLTEGRPPVRVTLTAEGAKLLADVHRTLQLYRSQPAA